MVRAFVLLNLPITLPSHLDYQSKKADYVYVGGISSTVATV